MPKTNPISAKNVALLAAIAEAGYETPKAFAEAIGIDYSHFSRILNLKAKPRKTRAALIARKLNKTVEEIGF